MEANVLNVAMSSPRFHLLTYSVNSTLPPDPLIYIPTTCGPLRGVGDGSGVGSSDGVGDGVNVACGSSVNIRVSDGASVSWFFLGLTLHAENPTELNNRNIIKHIFIFVRTFSRNNFV